MCSPLFENREGRDVVAATREEHRSLGNSGACSVQTDCEVLGQSFVTGFCEPNGAR